MKIIFKNRKIRNNTNHHKLFLLGILVYFFYKLFLRKDFYENILKKISKTQDKSKERKILEREKILQKNNIVFNQELRNMMLLNGRKYIDKCLSKSFISKEYKRISKPIISAIIPVYNCEKTINAAINSIQNQNFTDFEIVS